MFKFVHIIQNKTANKTHFKRCDKFEILHLEKFHKLEYEIM